MSIRARHGLVTFLAGEGAAPAWTPASPLPSGATPVDWFKSNTGLYKDAGKTQAATADADLIYTWDNLATGNDFVQATEANRPALKIVAGASFVRLDGSDDFMEMTISADSSQTIFIIFKSLIGVDATTRKVFSFAASANAGFYIKNTAPAGFKWARKQDTTQASFGGTVTNLNYVSVVFTDATACSVYFNGGTATAFDPDDTYAAQTSMVIGQSGACANGDFVEIIRYTSPLDNTDRAVVEAYLAARVANPT